MPRVSLLETRFEQLADALGRRVFEGWERKALVAHGSDLAPAPSPTGSRNQFLQALPPGDFEILRPHLRKVDLVRGRALYEPGDRVDRVYFPESGLVSLHTALRSGVEVENSKLGRESAVGFIEACGSRVMVARALVQIPGEALWAPVGRYREAFHRSRSVREEVHRRIELLLAEVRQSVACQALHPADARLARLLLESADRTGDDRLPLTQAFLAGMIGVARTTVTRVAGDLQTRGLIRYARGLVEISDRRGLTEASCECYGDLLDIRRAVLGPERRVLAAR